MNGEKEEGNVGDENIEVGEEKEKKGGEEKWGTEKEFYEEYTMTELEAALKGMKDGKAAGEDGIVVEFLKAIPKERREELREAMNKIWREGSLAKGWETARIVPIYKDADRDRAENYRGVSLLNVGYKVLTKMMTTRLSRWIEKNGKLKESQAGFRKGRGTRDQIFTLNAVINKTLKRKGGRLYVAFIDFKAAFDRVNRERMIKKIRAKRNWR